VTLYRQRVLVEMQALLAGEAPFGRALDFGAGDGWFAKQLRESGLLNDLVCVDVQERSQQLVRSLLYDGRRLPFEDRVFDLAYSVDVLHHCLDPRDSLKDLLRCTKRHFLLKDHTFSTRLGWLTLCALDEIGNRRFGVPSRYRYQRDWEWLAFIRDEGFELKRLVHPVHCHSGLLGRATNSLQFLALFTRMD
jgi:SAM-dependent methyltransferase